ncbi:MAG TPA: hypothetical protein VGA61_11210 [Anaerolineae bacterium]
MGPVEIIFITIIILFGIIGVARGFHKELGITTMLLLTLFLIELAESRFATQLNGLLSLIGGEGNLTVTKAIVYTLALLGVTFISYQGETLTFPGGGRSHIVAAMVGLLNGYLLVGSIWHYLAQANWAGMGIRPPFTQFYQVAVKLLPPAVLDWPFLIIMVALMLILRVWK